MDFSDLIFEEKIEGAIHRKQARIFFSNGYGASVVQNLIYLPDRNIAGDIVVVAGSYGAEKGLYELAVLSFGNDGWTLDYTTPVTSDVEGRLTPEDVSDLLAKIEALPEKRR